MPLGKVGRRRVSDETEASILAWNQQRIECQKHLAEKYQLENQITKAAYLDKSELGRALEVIGDAMRAIIVSSDLSRSAKEDVSREISSIPAVLEQIARNQNRLKEAKTVKRAKGLHKNDRKQTKAKVPLSEITI
jgi:ABC-type phosphate transport system auxiliary subunit